MSIATDNGDEKSQNEDAIKSYQQQLDIAIETDNVEMQTSVLDKLGSLYKHTGDHDMAIEYYEKALVVAVATDDKQSQYKAYSTLASAYLSVNKPRTALLCSEKRKSIAIAIGDKEAELNCHKVLGYLYFDLGQHEDAIKSYQQQLAIAIETNNEEGQKSTYIEMAQAYHKTNQFLQAINCYKECLKFAMTEDEEQKEMVYHNLGGACQELKNFDEAINYYEEAFKITAKHTSNEIKRYINLGYCFFSQGKIEKASDCYVKGLELAITLDEQNLQGKAYDKLGSLYKHTGDHDKAIEYYEKGLAVAVTADDKQSQATAFENLGNVYRNKGKHNQAIKCHERQLQICINIASKNGQVQAYGNLGMDYDKLGNYNEVINNLTKLLEICVEIDDKEGEADAHYNLGIAYQAIGQYPECLAHNEESLKLARQIGKLDLEVKVNDNLGNYFMHLEKYDKAGEHYRETLEIVLEVADEKRKASLYGKLGICKIISDEYNDALDLFDKQIGIAERIKNKDQESRGYRGKGQVCQLLGDYEQALYCYENALAIDKATDDKSGLSQNFLILGGLYRDMARLNMEKGEKVKKEHYLAKSIHFFKEGLTWVEWQFDQLQKQDHFKVSYLETIITRYNNLTITLFANGDHKEALLASERGRARALNDLLISKYNINSDKQSGNDRITYDEIQNMASDLSILCYSRFPPAGQSTWVICKGNVSSRFEECNFSNILESAYGALKVREVQCEDRSVQTDEHQQQHKVSVSQQKSNVIDDVFEKFLLSACKLMLKTRCIPDEDLYDDDNPNPLEGLYKSLISPVQDQLITDEIVIIPDGDLFKVPFAALRNPKTGKYFSETKRIRFAPSLTSLKALQESPADFHSKTGALIIGNPKVGKVMFRGETKEMSDLPCAEREAEMIGKLLGVKPFIQSQATKEISKQNLRKGVAIIHFAAHGTTDGEIFLAPSTTGDHDLPSEEDYILTMKDVQESGVRPQLVVLSCCHSGRGEIKAEGVVGMSRAFLAAGARAVVASLWAIADEATMVFMEKFYTHLKEGESASKSLQAAMKDMREIPRYSDPQFWAPFFLIGDDVTIKMEDK